MKYISSNFILIIVLLFCKEGVVAEGNGARKTLTRQQTLGLAGLNLTNQINFNLYSYSDPCVLNELIELVEANLKYESKKHIVRAIGFIGTSEAVPVLEQQLKLDMKSKWLMGECYIQAFAILARREIKGSRDIFEKMTKPSFWRQIISEKLLKTSQIRIGLDFDLALTSVYYYRCSKGKDLNKVVNHLLNAVQDKGRDAKRTVVDSTSNDNILSEKFFDYKSYEFPNEQICKKLDLLYKTEIETLLESRAIDSHRLARINKIYNEALKAFKEIKGKVVGGDLAYVARHVLDDGKRLKKKELQKLSPEYEFEFQKLANLIQTHFADSNLWPRLHSLEIRDQFNNYSKVSSEKNNMRLSSENFIVRILMTKSSGIGSVVFKNKLGSETVAKDGSLILYLKKEGGQWYWLPFGW